MDYLEAIEIIKEMATELNISTNSRQGPALLLAIISLQTQRVYVTEPIWGNDINNIGEIDDIRRKKRTEITD